MSPEDRPLQLVINRCGYSWGIWVCDNPDHPNRPDDHYMVHQEAS